MKNLEKCEVRSHRNCAKLRAFFRRKWSAFCTCGTTMPEAGTDKLYKQSILQ